MGVGNCFPVTYNDRKLVELNVQLVERAFSLLSLPYGRGLSSEGIREYTNELFELFSVHALRSVLFFKHEAYKNESEYRFLQVHTAQTHRLRRQN